MSTFITRLESSGTGPRLAVKDLIDVEGVPTTAGSRAVAESATPAEKDAPCLAGARAAGARIVGKANLHELAFGATGINPWFGTAENPLDPALVPGGSSSGSAVAVATREADVAYGSDTGGSVRMPSACCGTTGLKTTHGRVSLEGVWPLALSLDTIGPMARDIAGVILGMQLLEPGFTVSDAAPTVVGRYRLANTDPEIDAAIDRALAAAEVDVVDIQLPGLEGAWGANGILLIAEAWDADGHLLESGAQLGEDVTMRLQLGKGVDADQRRAAEEVRKTWQAELAAAFERVQMIALPTLPVFPPPIDGMPDELLMTTATGPFNLAGTPALSLPVPTGGRLPASLQLVGPHNSEELLLAAGAVVEAAIS
ncbi:MAG: amidase [Acidimicrobiales bacterium]|nr:amidase [Acidimicrobiales bacterium]